MKTSVAAAVVIAFVVGLVLGRYGRVEASTLAHSLETISLCANALNSLAGHEAPTTNRLLDRQLRSAVESATKVSDAAYLFELDAPNLVEGVNRAKVYADRIGDNILSEQIAALQRAIGPHKTITP
jgi:hypothetical protein